tara:strand:+ start:678 stop:881 length:204 start_codon:yes stop_codon:yes gene_type:complete
VYVVSDSQLEDIKRKQRQEELDSLEASQERLEEVYKTRLKIMNKKKLELKEELKALSPSSQAKDIKE